MGCHCHHLELAIKHALSHCEAQIQDLAEFSSATRNNDPLRRLLQRYSDGAAVRLPQQGTTRWGYLFRTLHKFTQLLPTLQKVQSAYYNQQIVDDIPALELLLSPLLDDRRLRLYHGLHRLLEPVVSALDFLQGDSYPTLPMVQLLAHVLRRSADEMLKDLDNDRASSATLKIVCSAMKRELKNRFGYPPLPLDDGYVPVDYIAAALDPRTKDLQFLPMKEHPFVWAELTKLAASLSHPSPVLPTLPPRPQTSLERLLGVPSPAGPTNVPKVSDEITRYQSERAIFCSGDPLVWWRGRQAVFPVLASLAKVSGFIFLL